MVSAPQTLDRYRHGLRKTGALVALTSLAASTPATLYQLTPTGNRTCILRKLILQNRTALDGRLQIGTGLAVAFVQQIPDYFVSAGMDLQLDETLIPEFESNADLTFQVTFITGVAGADVHAQAEVDEYGE